MIFFGVAYFLTCWVVEKTTTRAVFVGCVSVLSGNLCFQNPVEKTLPSSVVTCRVSSGGKASRHFFILRIFRMMASNHVALQGEDAGIQLS